MVEGVLRRKRGGVTATMGPNGWRSPDATFAGRLAVLFPPPATECGTPWVIAFWQAVKELGADVVQEPEPDPWPGVRTSLATAKAATFADDVASAGHDGAQAEKLLHAAVKEGGAKLAAVTRSAVARLLADPEKARKAKRLFDDAEHEALAGTLAAVSATGELLGRSRIRRRANQVEARTFADRPRRFSEEPTDLRVFAEPIRVLPPEEALSYFRSLVPDLTDDKRFNDRHERQAFTLAGQTDEVLLGKVQDAIAERLETGVAIGAAPAEIEAILDAAGAGRGGGYAEMVFRTNAVESFNVGSQRELAEVTDTFPWWRYANPTDGRSRPEHAARNGKYYSSGVPFTEVRGTDPADACNCRCIGIPIDRFEVEDLKAQGEKVER